MPIEMSSTKDIRIEEFDYPLEPHRIAKYPLKERDLSKLLVYKAGEIHESVYRNLPNALPEGARLIFNNTKVVQARLLFRLPTGREIELFCLEPDADFLDINLAMQQKKEVKWHCLVGGNKKWKDGVILEGSLGNTTIKAERLSRGVDSFLIRFFWEPIALTFAEVLDELGKTPLPPYLKRDAEQSDKERYQTVYAEHEGSVAAPTAGLHFTSSLLEKLSNDGFQQSFVTLHVGAGTFKPVSSDTIGNHEMHHELIQADVELIRSIAQEEGSVIPVGTTSMRTLESLYYLGVKVLNHPDITLKDLHVSQWDPYQTALKPTKESALNALASYLEKKGLKKVMTKTQLMIAPGYTFQICNGLITNFHQPKSTLMLLVAALIGDDWAKVYRYAIDHDFRFLSYGDGSLLLP